MLIVWNYLLFIWELEKDSEMGQVKQGVLSIFIR